MRVPQKRQIGCSSTSSAGFSTSSELSARSNSSDESWSMALDVMSFGVTRKTWSGLCLGSSCIFPSYLHAANHFHRCVVISNPFKKGFFGDAPNPGSRLLALCTPAAFHDSSAGFDVISSHGSQEQRELLPVPLF